MIKEYERELNELQEGKLISKEDLHEGDEIIYNGEHYFVTRTDTGTDYVWITDDKSERYNRNAQGWTLKADWIDEVIGQPEEDELEEAVKTSDRYEVARYSRFWYGIMDNHTNLLLRVGPNADYSKPLDKENNKLLLFHSREEAQSYIDSKLSSRQDLKESTVNESLDFTNFAFIVKCNDGPKELIRVIAEDRSKAEEYAKKMYAQNHTTYADDRHNIWSIDEGLSSDIDKVKHAVDQFKGQVTVSKDSGNDVREYLLSKNISFMIDDSKSAKGKLTFMLKYPIPKLLNKNENLSGNMTKEAEEKLTTYYQIWAKGPSDSKFHFQDEYAYLSELVEEAKGYMQGDSQVRVLEVEEDESGNVVKRNGEVLFYSDGAVQTVDKELFDVATPQETADMFGKKVYSKKENKLYTPTGPVFETDNLTESKEDTQYGVHSFSQSSIIFRGTEEECAEFIADHNLWDDAEIYAMTPDDPHYLKESEEDGLEDATQEYTSANTSINSAKLPAIFSMVNFKPETINLDYGGGKFDNATTALEGKGVTNLIYDPYNRSSGHNKDVIDTVRKNGGADTVTCSNVLNVIKEPEARKAVIKNIYSLLKNSGTAYFTVYEGTGKGDEGPTRSGYQLNKKTGDYVEEISSVFPSVSRHGKLIIASKGTSVTEGFDDDWSDTLETGGEPTYCPDCGVKFVRDEEGDAICPKCNKTPYQLANERRKNESLNENDTKYTATGRKKLVSDEIMSLAVEAARTIDPNAKRDYDDDFIYGDDGHGGSTWVILLNGDGKAYSTWGRNAVLTSKVEKAVNDAADAYWADFDKRWEENNKYLTAKGIKESALNETYYAVIEVDGKERRFPFNNRDTARDYIAKAQRGELPEFKGKKIGSTYTEAFNVVREEVKPNIESKDESLKEGVDRDNADVNRHLASLKEIPDNFMEDNDYRGYKGEIIIPDGVTSIGEDAFRGCSGITSITIPDSVTRIGLGAFNGCSGLKSVTIPDSVKSISGGAFFRCTGLSSIEIPDSVSSIGDHAFGTCYGLKSVTIGSSVTYLGWGAFKNCYGLKSITIPSSVTSINPETFKYCDSLTSIDIPNSVTLIGEDAFNGCTKLKNIMYKGTIAEWKGISKWYGWKEEVPKSCTIHCTDGDIGLFKSSKDGSVNESLDFTNTADVRHRLDSYSEQYLTVTFRGSYDWKYISDLLEEYNDGDEEEADLALDKLEAVYGSEYKLLKALEVDEIRDFTAMDRDIIVTIKVDKDDLYRNYADLINNPSIKKDTVKILELELNESLKKRYKKFPLKENKRKNYKRGFRFYR